MGIDDIYYDTETQSYRVEIDNINYTITPDILNVFKIPGDIKEKYLEKFDGILSDVLIEFYGSGIRLFHSDLFSLEGRRSVVIKIFISGKKTLLEYDIDAHEISGLVWMSLGDRDLTEITTEEIEIIRRALLIWIYENV